MVNNELHEIKGLHFFINRNPLNEMCNPYNHKKDKIAEAKHQCMIKNNVIILKYAELQNLKLYLHK